MVILLVERVSWLGVTLHSMHPLSVCGPVFPRQHLVRDVGVGECLEGVFGSAWNGMRVIVIVVGVSH